MALNGLAATFLAVGFLAGVAGFGLMYYSVEDEERNDGWAFFRDGERTDENVRRYEAGRVLAIGGIIVLVAGVVVAAAAEPRDD